MSEPTTKQRSGLRWTLVIVIGFSCVAAIWVGLLPEWAYWRAERRSISQLAHASSSEDLSNAVGGPGVVLRRSDGGWIAIRYSDSHSDPLFSCTVARTSDGRWLRSRTHYCGLFSSYRGIASQLVLMRDLGPDMAEGVKSTEEWFHEGDQSHLWAAEHAVSMDEAIRELEVIGFEAFRPGVTVMPVLESGGNDGTDGAR